MTDALKQYGEAMGDVEFECCMYYILRVLVLYKLKGTLRPTTSVLIG